VTRSEHPTHIPIEQLSAFLDQQLTAEEQATVDAHLRSCEQCRLALADLRATVALVRALPQEAVPRSFALPLNVTPLPIQAAREDGRERRDQRHPVSVPARRQSPTRPVARPVAHNPFRRSLRFVSAIAAVLGLLVILSGLWSAIPFGHLSSGSATEPSSAPAASSNQSTAVIPHVTTPIPEGTRSTGLTQPGQKGKTPITNTVRPGTPTQTTSSGSGSSGNTQQVPTSPSFSLPSLLDLSTIQSRLGLGLALVVVGIIGLLLTRRRYHRTP
jgi:hypothetical protein